MIHTLQFAREYRDAGISVLPIRTDKSKAPAIGKWAHLQERLATPEEMLALFRTDCGLAAIGGKVSGNLEVYDIDQAQYFEPWKELVVNHLGAEFFSRLPIVRTPRPGYHVYTRCETVAGNQKLAMKFIADPEHPAGRTTKTLIETRAEGGYVLLPGCPPSCHETGRTYELVQGSLAGIPIITSREREILLSCARSFNEVVREESHAPASQAPAADSPGVDFVARSSWDEILKPHGYQFAGHHGDVTLWTRPGKEHGISASTNYAGSDLFYPFSTNCYPFESERGYNKFSVFTLLNHGGDFHAAARALASQGYGAPARAPRVVEFPRVDPAPAKEPLRSSIVEPYALRAKMTALYKTGLMPGESPGWESLRKHWTLRKGELTLVTGIPSHGKSSFMNSVMMNLARSKDWRWGVYSAENLPHELHTADLIEQYAGKPYSEGYFPRVDPLEHDQAYAFIQRQFRFIAPPEDIENIDEVLKAAEELVSAFRMDALIIDPWNELNHSWAELRIPETEYISRTLKRLKRFASSRNVHVVLVAHPAKLEKNKDGAYPIPTPYDISGSAHWRNKADCAICVWRDEGRPGESTIFIQKIRRRFVGKIGKVELRYNVVNGRFTEPPMLERYSREPGADDE